MAEVLIARQRIDSLPTAMVAIRVNEFGGPEALVQTVLSLPELQAGHVLVRVHAAGVGPWDAWLRSGTSAVHPQLPFTPGSDISGVVVAFGSDVDQFLVNQPVYGVTNAGFTDGYAQYALATSAMLAPKPLSLSYLEAASAPVVAVTAAQMLFRHAQLQRGQRVLIHGAGGNVGHYAVQLAAQAGLIVAVTSSSRDSARLRALGASRLLDRDAPGQLEVDAVIDLVGGAEQDALFNFLPPGGKLISAVREPDVLLATERAVEARFILVDVNAADLAAIGTGFDTAILIPWVGSVLPLNQARKAHEMLAGSVPHEPGKIVLEVRRDD